MPLRKRLAVIVRLKTRGELQGEGVSEDGTHAGAMPLWVELAIGLALVAIVLFIQDHGFFRTNTDDAAADELMRFHAGVVDENRQANPFALIAIDEQTYRDWGEPLITPRDKLAKIIEFAIKGPAKLIFVDIELSRLGNGTPIRRRQDGTIPPVPCNCLGEADARLSKVIRQAGRPIILAQTIIPGTGFQPGKERWEVRPSLLDLGADSPPPPHVYRASPLYSVDSDRFIRRSRIWQLVCENKQRKAIPSVELLTLALVNHKEDALKETMGSISGGDCGHPVDLTRAVPLELATSDGRPFSIDLKPESAGDTPKSPGDRILYAIGWSGEPSRLYADQPGQERRPQVIIPKNDLPNSDRKADLVTTISARAITDVADSARPDPKVVENHIVVIGATHREAGDLHETPLGLMPGSLIIINAMHSLREYGQLAEPAIWQKVALATVVMIIVVLLYHYVWSTLAALVVALLIFLLAFSLNVLFVRQGVWIDAALPGLIYVVLEKIRTYFFEFCARVEKCRGSNGTGFWAYMRALRN